MSDFGLDKTYKLCSKVVIDDLFSSGKTIKVFPFIAIIKPQQLSTKAPFQIVFSAPKRTFRKAHERNRIKRICKEAVRLNKEPLELYLKESNQQLALFLVYSSAEELNHIQLKKKITKLFNEIIKHLNENH